MSKVAKLLVSSYSPVRYAGKFRICLIITLLIGNVGTFETTYGFSMHINIKNELCLEFQYEEYTGKLNIVAF